MTPNEHQMRKREQLREKLGSRTTLPSLGMSDCGYDFTEVDGVTVVITKSSRNADDRGGYKVPALRGYKETVTPSNLDAAVGARELFDKQRQRDNNDIERAKKHKRGHLGPRVKPNWFCNDEDCPCQRETDINERRKRSLLN